MWHSKYLIIACVVLSLLPSGAPGRPTPAQSSNSAKPVRARAVVAEVRRVIGERYVLPERRPIIDKELADSLRSGRYDVDEPAELAERISTDLERAVHDVHLNIKFSPQQALALTSKEEKATPASASRIDQNRESNHGIEELRLLPGNVRYMGYDNFVWSGADSAAELDRAMHFLTGGDAAIIDLRRNGGGNELAIQYIISHFLPPKTPLFTSYFSGSDPERTATLDKLPTPRMIGKPLYVLVSGNTGSAAEAFAGAVADLHIGELVGETTGGAGYHNDLFSIDNRYVLSVSVGRAVIDASGRGWEKVGIQPTIPTKVDAALETAQLLALRRLANAASAPSLKLRFELLAEAAMAQLEKQSPGHPLQSYVGSFGERAISLDDGQLYYTRRARALPTVLIPLGGDRFALATDPIQRFEFETDGTNLTAFKFGSADTASSARYERTR